MFLLASVSVIGCVWALVRHYTHPPVPMTRPVPAQVQTQDSGEIQQENPGETPAPPLVPVD